MWFYPLKRLSTDPKAHYKILGLSCAAHVLVILALLISGLNNRSVHTLIVGGAPGKGKPKASISFGRSRRIKSTGSAPASAVIGITHSSKSQDKQEHKRASKKIHKNISVQDKQPQATPLVKEYSLLPKRKIKTVSNKKRSEVKPIEPVQQPEIKKEKEPEIVPPVQQEIKLPEAASVIQSVSQDNLVASEPITTNLLLDGAYEEGDSADAALCQELTNNLTIPPGFEDHGSITISYELDLTGKVIAISPKKEGDAPALYMALKDAILKCHYPLQKWGTKIELTYKAH